MKWPFVKRSKYEDLWKEHGNLYFEYNSLKRKFERSKPKRDRLGRFVKIEKDPRVGTI